MTVQELIEKLQALPDTARDRDVYIEYEDCYGEIMHETIKNVEIDCDGIQYGINLTSIWE